MSTFSFNACLKTSELTETSVIYGDVKMQEYHCIKKLIPVPKWRLHWRVGHIDDIIQRLCSMTICRPNINGDNAQ